MKSIKHELSMDTVDIFVVLTTKLTNLIGNNIMWNKKP